MSSTAGAADRRRAALGARQAPPAVRHLPPHRDTLDRLPRPPAQYRLDDDAGRRLGATTEDQGAGVADTRPPHPVGERRATRCVFTISLV